VNGESNGERTDIERDVSERMRELWRRSGKARRRKATAKQTGEFELTDREQAKVALRRALDGNNMAAMVAAAKALIEFDRSPDREQVTVEDARARSWMPSSHRSSSTDGGTRRGARCATGSDTS
jgi:hypothetical protein